MSTEREQLELAAKACGYKYSDLVFAGEVGLVLVGPYQQMSWNPKHDDGDCARMEAQLGIDLVWFDCKVRARAWEYGHRRTVFFDDHSGDKNAARRAASVGVAAEIGRTM